MLSCLYEGKVRHRRLAPVVHAFEFSLFMLYLDLAELPRVFGGAWLWSAKRPAFAWFRRRDHLGDPRLPLDTCVRDLVEERTGLRPGGPIRLLTHLRYAGYAMNPISLFYCFEATGERLEAVVAEVNNTPWGERHCYVLSASAEGHESAELSACTAKQFHVSPFMAMDLDYAWRIGVPGERLALSIANHESNGERFFEAALALERRPLTARNRARVLLRQPLLTARVAAAIYWQALRLHLKGAPFHPHPRERGASLELIS